VKNTIMRVSFWRRALLLSLAVLVANWCSGFGFTAVGSDGALKLNPVFTDNMVLQRDANTAIFGTAVSGLTVEVEFAGQQKEVVADANGEWRLQLDPMSASTAGRSLIVRIKDDSSSSITIQYVLVGDVWLCAGQSNMAYKMNMHYTYGLSYADIPNVSYLTLGTDVMDSPQKLITLPSWQPEWTPLEGESAIQGCLAVSYFFAEKWAQDSEVPVGFIGAAEGGKILETFMSSESLENLPNGIEIPATATFNIPSTLYNSMIHPLLPLTIKGVIWYQAESNTFRNAPDYGTLFKIMISDWRNRWGQGDFPFLFVQLPSQNVPGGNRCEKAIIRDSQAEALELSNTYMVATIDVGEYENVHPFNKQPVGERLALVAEMLDGADVLWHSPEYDGKTAGTNGSFDVRFRNLEGTALVGKQVVMNKVRDMPVGTDPEAFVMEADPLYGFEICGSDGQFVPANATITSTNTVNVWSSEVAEPTEIRYGWRNFSLCNLATSEGLPVVPFRTDFFDPNDIGVFFGTGSFDEPAGGVSQRFDLTSAVYNSASGITRCETSFSVTNYATYVEEPLHTIAQWVNPPANFDIFPKNELFLFSWNEDLGTNAFLCWIQTDDGEPFAIDLTQPGSTFSVTIRSTLEAYAQSVLDPSVHFVVRQLGVWYVSETNFTQTVSIDLAAQKWAVFDTTVISSFMTLDGAVFGTPVLDNVDAVGFFAKNIGDLRFEGVGVISGE